MAATRLFFPARVRTGRILALALLAETVLLAYVVRYTDFTASGAALRMAVCGAAAGLAQWAAVWAYGRMNYPPRTATVIFWTVAVGWRVLMLPAEPGDDFWRYRWEGTIQLHRINPYLVPPDSPAVTSLRDADWACVNHRDYSAIYPPAAELIFAVLAAIHLPPMGWKMVFALADLGVVTMLLRLLSVRGSSPRGPPLAAAVWYAWNPLAIYVFAGGGHYDSLMLLALVAAVWTLDRACAIRPAPMTILNAPSHLAAAALTASSLTFAWVSAIWLGLAIALKLVPAALLPVWFFALGWRRAFLVLPFAVAVLPVAAGIYGFPHAPIFLSLEKFAYVTRLNDSVWWLVESLARNNREQVNGAYQKVIVLACVALAIYFRGHWQRGVLWVMGGVLLLSPVMHPWYLVWILPFAVWRAESGGVPAHLPRAWLVLAGSMFGYFALWDLNRTSAPWVEPLWLRLTIYLPPCVYLLFQWAGNRAAPVAPAEQPG